MEKETIFEIKEKKNEFYHSINAFYTDETITLIGYGCNVYNINGNIFCKFAKSVKTIKKIDNEHILIGSYDGTCILFKYNSEKVKYTYVDTIKGPETEIKGISSNSLFVALATRGKTVWIFKYKKEIELTQILEDHTGDVKGVHFEGDRLFTWSYDNTVKIYDMIVDEWEMQHEIDCKCTIWNVFVTAKHIVTVLQSGNINIYDKSTYELLKTISLSITPITESFYDQNNFYFVCNEKVLLILDGEYQKVDEIEFERNLTDIYVKNKIIYVSDSIDVYKINFTE